MNGDEPAYPNDYTSGLTKRELIAAMAMQGLLANPETNLHLDAEWVSQETVRQADALLAALKEPTK